MCDQVQPFEVCESVFVCVRVRMCVSARVDEMRAFGSSRLMTDTPNATLNANKKKGKCRHSRPTFFASLVLALNVSCTQRMQEKCNLSPLRSTYRWKLFMGIRNYVEDTFSCSFPKNNIHVLTQLSAAVDRKESHRTFSSLSKHFCAVLVPQL